MNFKMNRCKALLMIIVLLITFFSAKATDVYAAKKPETITKKALNPVKKGVHVAWFSVEDADRYLIYRKTGNSKWKLLKSTTELHYIDKTAKKGIRYTYSIRAVSGKRKGNHSSLSIKLVSRKAALKTISRKQINAYKKQGYTDGPHIKYLGKEIIPWADVGYGVHYKIKFKITSSKVRNIDVGCSVNTRLTDSEVLNDRWCKITVDDGREFVVPYKDLALLWSDDRSAMQEELSTAGGFELKIPVGIKKGNIVTVEVYQRVMKKSDTVSTQIGVADITDPYPGYPLSTVYGLVVYNDYLGYEINYDNYLSPKNGGKWIK